jgi:hypothetical protein
MLKNSFVLEVVLDLMLRCREKKMQYHKAACRMERIKCGKEPRDGVYRFRGWREDTK